MPVNTKRVDEVSSEINRHYHVENGTLQTIAKAYLSSLLEFQTQEWIRCSERMPEEDNSTVYFVRSGIVDCGVYRTDDDSPWQSRIDSYSTIETSHWQPRHVPAPPEEESELVKYVRTKINDKGMEGISAIQAIKEFEKAGKK